MIHWHPDETTLMEFISGKISTAHGICIASHLHYCDHCRSICKDLTILGATVLENDLDSEEEVSESLLNSTLDRLEERPTPRRQSIPQATTSSAEFKNLPPAIRKLIAQKSTSESGWKWRWPKLRILDLVEDGPLSLSLYKIGAGGKMPNHDHRGEEITLVLDGSFSDRFGTYHEGDIVVRQKAEEHTPIASQSKDCICLVLESDLPHFSGLSGKLLNTAQQLFAGSRA